MKPLSVGVVTLSGKYPDGKSFDMVIDSELCHEFASLFKSAHKTMQLLYRRRQRQARTPRKA